MEVGPAELASYQKDMTDQEILIFLSQYGSARKDRSIALILSVLFGWLGIDRFYAEDVGIGILKLLTLGGCGLIWIVDCFLIMGSVDDHNRHKAREIAAVIKANWSSR